MDALSRFLTDEQDPAVVQKIHGRVLELLTRDEALEYIAVQKKPVVNISPDAVVLTNRRFMIIRPKLLGMTFEDHPWREVADIHMSEQMLGATITCTTVTGTRSMIDSLPKKQARRIYAYAQEVEENAYAARRRADLERLSASAGKVVVTAQPTSPPPLPKLAVPSEDPVAVLSKLKQMLDGGLIQQAEYDTKKSEILARL
jgi:ribosomal protein S19